MREREPESSPLDYVYTALILLGVGIAFYVYVIAFNRLSETMLIRLTPVWVFPLVFGGYGFAAERVIRIVRAGKAADLGEGVRKWTQGFGNYGLIALVLLAPFLVLGKWRNSLLVSFVASLFWILVLVVFFEMIFPKL